MRRVGGIFVGGRSTRMGGRPKGLLPHPDGGSLVEHLARVLDRVGAEVVLVGAHDAYAELPWPRLVDSPARVGPIGGLCSLLRRAEGGEAVAVACDMPRVDEEDLQRLLASRGERLAAAPVRDGRWEPLCAVYDARALAIAERRALEGALSLQGLLRELNAAQVRLPPDHLEDWDAPGDISAS